MWLIDSRALLIAPRSHFVTHPLHEIAANGEEQMDTEMGPRRAEGLRASGMVPWVPCTVTKSTERFMRIWLCPVNWKSMTEADWKAFQTSVAGEADESDLNLVSDFSKDMFADADASVAGDASASASDCSAAKLPEVVVKTEVKTEREKMADRIVVFKNNRESVLKRYQDMELKAKRIRTNANANSNTAFKQTFLTSLETHINDLKKTLVALMYIKLVTYFKGWLREGTRKLEQRKSHICYKKSNNLKIQKNNHHL